MNWVASALDSGGSEATPKFPALHTVHLLPLRPLTSCSLAPSSLSLPHPGTSAGKDSAKKSWAACGPRAPLCWQKTSEPAPAPAPTPTSPAPGTTGNRRAVSLTQVGSPFLGVTELVQRGLPISPFCTWTSFSQSTYEGQVPLSLTLWQESSPSMAVAHVAHNLYPARPYSLDPLLASSPARRVQPLPSLPSCLQGL